MLKVVNLAVKYPGSDHHVVQNVSFELPSKSILGIFGRSGSGKTTLLKAVAGLMQPAKGQILLNDEVIDGPEDKLVPGHEEIRLVFQDFRLKHLMTIAENIRYELLPYEVDYREDRLEKMLRICLLEEFKDTFVEALSGGQKQRVAVARALATEPQLILMDEPFSNLDMGAKSLLRKALHNIIDETSSSLIFVSHDPEEALALCDQLVVIDEGKIKQTGTPQDIYERPATLEIASLFSRLSSVQQEDEILYYRPESFVIDVTGKADFEGTVTRVDYLGSHQLLRLNDVKGSKLIVRDEKFQHKKGDVVKSSMTHSPVIVKRRN